MATALRKAGELCWINMLTPRAAEVEWRPGPEEDGAIGEAQS